MIKKILKLLALSLLFPSVAFGQLTLPQGGIGTSTVPVGQILFGRNAQRLTSSSNLFWDNTNTRLGIGTTSPQSAVDIVGENSPEFRIHDLGNQSSARIETGGGEA